VKIQDLAAAETETPGESTPRGFSRSMGEENMTNLPRSRSPRALLAFGSVCRGMSFNNPIGRFRDNCRIQHRSSECG
jgi:hypothetical protein